jgi:hypothetical protein
MKRHTAKHHRWVGLVGAIAVSVVALAGCSDGSGGDQAQAPDAVADGAASNPSQPTAEPLLANPMLAPSANQKVAAVPGLLRPTDAKARMPAIQSGRPDPFAAVPAPTTVITTAKPNSKPTQSLGAAASRPTVVGNAPLSPLPVVPITVPMAPLPNLPNLPVNGSTAALPPINIPVAPPLATSSPTYLAEAIQVSGVVQVSGRWTVIVKEPNSSSSRYVKVGDYLENGKVLVKKIVASGNAEPSVVLQQNGVEVRKSLG